MEELIASSKKKSMGIAGEIQHQNTMNSENGRKIELTISKSMSMSEKEDEKIVSETKTKPQTIVPSMKAHGPKYLNYELLLRSKAKLFSEFTFLLPDLKLCVMRYLNSKEVVSVVRYLISHYWTYRFSTNFVAHTFSFVSTGIEQIENLKISLQDDV